MTLCEAMNSGKPYRRPTFDRQHLPHDPNPYTTEYWTIDGRHIVQATITLPDGSPKDVLRTRRVLRPKDMIATDWEVLDEV